MIRWHMGDTCLECGSVLNLLDFETWWTYEGRFYDPDHSGVPWFDKRKFLAEYAWYASEARLKD